MRGLVGAGPGVAHGLQLLAGRRPVDAARSSRTACRARRGLVCRDASIHGPEEVVADYESVSLKGLEILAAMEGQDFEVPLGDVGTYPASAIPSTFAFEEYIHIRFDLFAPDGPLQGDHRPPTSYGWRRHSTGSKQRCPNRIRRSSIRWTRRWRYVSTASVDGRCSSAAATSVA